MHDQVRINKTRSRLLVTGFAVLISVVVVALVALLGLLGPPGLLATAVLVGGVTSVAYWASDSVALRLSRAQPASAVDHPRYHNVVEGLCTASGLPKPRLYVAADAAPNALVTGRNPRNAAVVLTTGLLERLNRVELEGVLAHELARIKTYYIRPSTLAVTMLAPLPLVGRFLSKVVSPERETLADLSAVSMTRYPPALVSALEKLGEDSSTVVASANRAIAHLWLCEPSGARGDAGKAPPPAAATHAPLPLRISLLREL